MSTYDTPPKVYDPQEVETKWYDFWMEKGYYHAEVDPSRILWLSIPHSTLISVHDSGHLSLSRPF